MKFPKPNEFETVFDHPVWLKVGAEICLRHGLRFLDIRRSEHGESVVLLVDDRFVVKVYKPSKRGFERETRALEFVAGKTRFRVPEIVGQGEMNGLVYSITTQLAGEHFTRDRWLQLEPSQQSCLLEELAAGLQELHSIDADWMDFDWPKFVEKQAAGALDRQRSEGGNPEWLDSLPRFIDENLELLPKGGKHTFLHGDVHFGNLRLSLNGGPPKITGLIDFADSLRGYHAYEFIAVGVLMIQGQGELQREFFRNYGYKDHEIDETLRRRMMLLTCFYEWSSLKRYAERLGPEAITYTLAELERAIWSFAS